MASASGRWGRAARSPGALTAQRPPQNGLIPIFGCRFPISPVSQFPGFSPVGRRSPADQGFPISTFPDLSGMLVILPSTHHCPARRLRRNRPPRASIRCPTLRRPALGVSTIRQNAPRARDAASPRPGRCGSARTLAPGTVVTSASTGGRKPPEGKPERRQELAAVAADPPGRPASPEEGVGPIGRLQSRGAYPVAADHGCHAGQGFRKGRADRAARCRTSPCCRTSGRVGVIARRTPLMATPCGGSPNASAACETGCRAGGGSAAGSRAGRRSRPPAGGRARVRPPPPGVDELERETVHQPSRMNSNRFKFRLRAPVPWRRRRLRRAPRFDRPVGLPGARSQSSMARLAERRPTSGFATPSRRRACGCPSLRELAARSGGGSARESGSGERKPRSSRTRGRIFSRQRI